MKIYEAWDALKGWVAEERHKTDGVSDPAWSAYEAVMEKIFDLEMKHE